MNKRIINYLSTMALIIFFFILVIMRSLEIYDFSSPDDYLLFLIIPFILFLSLFITSDKKIKKETLSLMLVLYSVFLLEIILTSGIYSTTFNGYRFGYINLVPFKSIISTIKDIKLYGSLKSLVIEIFKFLPFIIILPNINNKFKKWYVLIPFIALLSIAYELLEYFLKLGVVDIDDFILNITFSFIFYLLIYKTKLKDFISRILLDFTFKENKFGIETKAFTLKINRRFLTIIYYILFSLFLSSLTINLMVAIPLFQNKVSVSGLINCNKEEYLVADINNYRFYSTCAGNYRVVSNNVTSMSLESYLLSKNGNISKQVLDKFHIRREEVFKDIKVYENNLLGKVQVKNNLYFYNILDISFKYNNEEYNSYKEYLNSKHMSFYETLDRILENVYASPDFTISKSKYFNKVTCYNKDKYNEYYLPLKYKITNNTCNYLEKIKAK